MKSMNTIKFYRIAALFVIVFSIAACFSDWKGGDGTFSVSIGQDGGNSRTAISWSNYQVEELEHTITVSGGPGPEIKTVINGAKTVSYTVTPGRWNIYVESRKLLNNGVSELVAVGSAVVDIKPGNNDAVIIRMGQPAKIFYSISELQEWLENQPENTVATPYVVKLNVSDITGIGIALNTADRYVNLNLSGSTITSIPDETFQNCTKLTSVIIPDNITNIGGNAYNGCTSLASITIPDSVITIGTNAFNNTTWLNNQTNGLVYAGKFAYIYKGTMPANTSISLLDGTKGIADQAFDKCTNLTSITIPNSVITIGTKAFLECSSLTNVIIPNSVINIYWEAFGKCTSLTSVIIPNSVEYLGPSVFQKCSGLTTVTIGSGVTTIWGWTFQDCTKLTSVIIPNNVTTIEESAFNGCTSLTSVTFQGTISSSAFNSNSFNGDLRSKYLAADGGIGTYTRTSGSSTTWTKQP